MSWSKGKHSFAICDRSGFKIRYRDLKKDGHREGLLVDRRFWEAEHPQETPIRLVRDPQALRNPRPDTFTGATSYPTMNYTATQPGFTTYGPTTQLSEILGMTFGTAGAT